MNEMGDLKTLLQSAGRIEDSLDRKLFVSAVVTKACASLGVRPIVVGGTAVQFYLLGGYATVDIDMVMPGSDGLNRLMTELGFTRNGRHWEIAELDIFIEAPAPPLAGDIDRIEQVVIDDMPVYVIGCEDLILDRLRAYVHWKSAADGRWARRLLAEQAERLDMAYVEASAELEGLGEALREIGGLDPHA